jgi:hypothetical protein
MARQLPRQPRISKRIDLPERSKFVIGVFDCQVEAAGPPARAHRTFQHPNADL